MDSAPPQVSPLPAPGAAVAIEPEPPANPHVLEAWTVPRRLGDVSARSRELVLGGLAVAGAAVALVVPLSDQTLAHPGGFAAFVAWTVLSWTAAGLIWWRARPGSRVGPLLCSLGFVLGLQAFQGSASGLAFSVAVLLDGLAVFLAWYLTVLFPGPRLDGAGRMLLAFGGAVLLLAFLPKVLLSVEIGGATPLARCTAACPSNHLLIASEPGLAGVLGQIERWGARIAVTVALVTLLTIRVVRASRARRRTLLPVYVGIGLWLVAFAVYNTAVNADASPEVLDRIGLGVTFTRSLFPLAFIAALVLTRAHAGRALQAMVHELRRDSSLRAVELTVRRVLDDATARLAFWLPDRRQFVDVDAQPAELPSANSIAAVHLVGSIEREPLVAIVHDPALNEDPELVEAAGEATVLILENRRLDEELRQSREELELSERRLTAAVADERKRIERDLHDGSQQRLVAIRIGLELARERAETSPDTSARLAKLGEDLDRALEELRGAAQGIYPSVLADFGLRTALESAAGRSGVPTLVSLPQIPRFPAHIEAAVYFACVEALQNAAKHGGSGVRVKVRLWTEEDVLSFSVSDDGVGFVPGHREGGSGLRNMADRLAAVDGTFSLDSVPGRGTVATGSVRVDLAERA
jgi:signal transduction histidine kinase